MFMGRGEPCFVDLLYCMTIVLRMILIRRHHHSHPRLSGKWWWLPRSGNVGSITSGSGNGSNIVRGVVRIVLSHGLLSHGLLFRLPPYIYRQGLVLINAGDVEHDSCSPRARLVFVVSISG